MLMNNRSSLLDVLDDVDAIEAEVLQETGSATQQTQQNSPVQPLRTSSRHAYASGLSYEDRGRPARRPPGTATAAARSSHTNTPAATDLSVYLRTDDDADTATGSGAPLTGTSPPAPEAEVHRLLADVATAALSAQC